MKKLTFTIVLLITLLLSSTGSAHSTTGPAGWVLPQEEWTPEAQLWLSRAVTAEAGWNRRWRNQSEQILLAYILVDRFLIRKAMNPDETFVDTIRAYCRGMGKKRKRLSQRMMWLRGIQAPPTHMEGGHLVVDYPIDKPPHLYGVRWEGKYDRYWGRTWVTMAKWAHGWYGHPCPRARHWGHPRRDPVPKGHRLLSCSKRFRNNIYGRI